MVGPGRVGPGRRLCFFYKDQTSEPLRGNKKGIRMFKRNTTISRLSTLEPEKSEGRFACQQTILVDFDSRGPSLVLLALKNGRTRKNVRSESGLEFIIWPPPSLILLALKKRMHY